MLKARFSATDSWAEPEVGNDDIIAKCWKTGNIGDKQCNNYSFSQAAISSRKKAAICAHGSIDSGKTGFFKIAVSKERVKPP